MADLLNGENSGVVVDVRPTDFRAGGVSKIVYEAVNPSGNWSKFKPTDEWQRRFVPPGTLGYDTNSCTDFSCMNSIELQIERMISDNVVPQTTLDKMKNLGYFDDQGNVNLSDWYNAIQAGTTDAAGNTLYNPWDAARKDGNLPQSKGFKPNDFTDASGWFGSKPTLDQIALGKQFLSMFDIAYEWVAIGQFDIWDTISYHLKQAPIHILVPTGSTWNNAMVERPTPTFVGVNHAVTLISQKDGISHTILDHYNPFVKTLAWNYFMPYAVKGVVTLKKPALVPDTDLALGMTRPGVKLLQQWLNANGFPVAVTGVGSVGNETTYFGDLTRKALVKYQLARGIKPAEGYFGSITRAQMTKETPL